MRSYRYLYGYSLMGLISLAVSAIISLFVAAADRVLRADYGNAWRFSRDIGVAGFRKIADLKPVYRESYDSHGLSLYDGRRRC